MATKKPFRPARAYLPLDILINHIFIRLPVRSLLRCRCVCKPWLRLLTEPYFITMHLKHQKIHNHQNFLCGPIFSKDGCSGDYQKDYRANMRALRGAFYCLDLHSSSETADAVCLPGFSLYLKNYSIVTPLGYCNGMVCMEVINDLEKDYRKRRHLLFGNPSTGDYRILPELITSLPLLIGFGCDSSLDDYKCVWIDNLTRNPHIYSLKLKSWRTNLGSSDNYAVKPYAVKPERYSYNVGIALDRSIYWLVEISNIIVEFDFKDEEFRELPLPSDTPRGVPHKTFSMKVLGGSLCIINDYVFNSNVVEIWRMLKQDANNNKEEKCCCWSKLMRVTLSPRHLGIYCIRPLSFMKDGKVLCWVGDDLDDSEDNAFVLINPKTKRVEDFAIRDETGDDWTEQYTFEEPPMAYIDTLVSPN